MIGAGQKFFNAGETSDDFQENKLLDNLEKIKTLIFKVLLNVLG